ncbi:MAG: recombination protein RecR, partial [Acidobacteriota bacterium]
MPEHAKPMARLIEELRHLPGIGSKSAQRIAFHVLEVGTHDVERLTAALRD